MKRTCEHCGVDFETGQPSARFCTRAHKNASSNLEKARGQAIYRAAYHWRVGTGRMPAGGTPEERNKIKERGKNAFGDLTWLMDQFITEDREAGVVPPPGLRPLEYGTAHKPPKRDKSLRERELVDAVLGATNEETVDELSD